MTSLIERIEAAAGLCRELDTLIFAEFCPKDFDAANGVLHVPLYTSSIDAAMTLVGDGWGARIYMDRGNKSEVALESEPLEKYATALRPDKQVPLAICAAALRARGVE